LSTLKSSNVVNTKVAITPLSLETGFDYDIQKACRTHQPKPVTCASDAAAGWLLSFGGANNFLMTKFLGISLHFMTIGTNKENDVTLIGGLRPPLARNHVTRFLISESLFLDFKTPNPGIKIDQSARYSTEKRNASRQLDGILL
jgi:hypothetical protein